MISIPRNWIIAAIIIHIIAAWFSIGHYHDDEYHQILAFAAAKLGLLDTSELRWEYAAQLRSGFQPFIAYITKIPLTTLGIDSPFLHAFLLRLISGFLSLSAILLLIKSIASEIKNSAILKWGAFFLLFLWLQVFINIRFSSEGWATSLFLIGFSLYRLNTSQNKNIFFLIGLFFGFAFLSRYQVGLMLLGLGLWMIFIKKEIFLNLLPIFAGGLLALLIGFCCDWWLYDQPVFTAWNYLNTNLLQGRVEAFTHEAWWYYIYYSAVQILPPLTLGLPIVVLIFWVIFYKHPVTWVTVPFVLFHHLIGHKEMRFLFPVLPFAPVMFAFILDKYIYKNPINWSGLFFKTGRFLFYISIIINTVLLILVLFLPASKEAAMWQKCLSNINQDNNTVVITYDIGELNLHFYNEHKLKLISIDESSSLDEITQQYKKNTLFLATRRKSHLKKLSSSKLHYQLACQITPDWLTYFNFNNWTSRASLWRLWKIKVE